MRFASAALRGRPLRAPLHHDAPSLPSSLRQFVSQATKSHEKMEGERLSAPSGKVVYAAIISEAEDELRRPSSSLFFSGLAAGLSMGFSLIAEALLRGLLPDAPWQALISKLGYPLGFLVVILGRQQLFTENTLTPVLPLLRDKDRGTALNVARMWGVVLASNLLGGLAIALVIANSGLLPAEAHAAMKLTGAEALAPGFGVVFLRAIFGAWLIALIVWLLPFAESGRLWVIVILTYFVGLGHLSHVVAGSIQVFALAFTGGASWSDVCTTFVVPALFGNVLGGLILVAALSHAQVTAGGDGDV
jgi:formate/nitrite transporter FocA (FNT family)